MAMGAEEHARTMETAGLTTGGSRSSSAIWASDSPVGMAIGRGGPGLELATMRGTSPAPSLLLRRYLPPLVRSAVGSPCPIDRRFAPIFLRGSPRALLGQPWVRRVVGPVSRVGGDRLGRPFCERGRRRGGVRPRGCAQVVGHRRSIATLTGPRHLGLPAPVTS